MKPSMKYDVHIGCLGAVRKSRDASQKPPGITAHGSHPLGGGCDGGDCRGCGRGSAAVAVVLVVVDDKSR